MKIHDLLKAGHRAGFLALFLFATIGGSVGVEADDQSVREAAIWQRLAPYHRPPADFAGKLGSYRSPLKFADGAVAASPQDWSRRRQEILTTWRRRLGGWPSLLEHPAVKRLQSTQREGYQEHQVKIQIAPDGQMAEGFLLIPAGSGPFPAVLVPFYEPLTSIGRGERGQGTHDYGLQLVRRRFVTLSIGTPGWTSESGGNTRELLVEAGERQRQQPLLLLAYAAANCHTALAQMPEVDSERIGVIGLSYGGKWAMFASCLSDKFACAVWSDPGIVFNEADPNMNYWEPAVDRVDLFMTHGSGPEVTAIVDDITVRDDSGAVVFAEDFERYFPDQKTRTTPAMATEGRVRVSANPHYLEFRGKPILPLGDSVTQGWMEGGLDFDQTGYLDALARRGINVVLLWSFYATSAQAQLADPRIGYDAPELRSWKGSPDDKSIDLMSFNPAYFDRLREFVNDAGKRNILVIITVQDGWPKRAKFEHHPFNAASGNGPLTMNRQFVELADYEQEMPAQFRADWTRQQKNQYFQERFVEKLITELKDCSNVIFEMFNEGEWYDEEQRRRHEEHFLRFFRKRTAAPLMTNFDHVRSHDYSPRQNDAVDILSLHKKPWTGHYETFVKEFRAEPARVIFESEPVPAIGGLEPAQQGQAIVTPEIVLGTVWERALAGAGFVAQNDTSFGWNPKCGMAAQAALRDGVYDILGHAARFFNQSGVTFWEMAPHPELASTGRCLARPGVEYVIYAPAGGVFTVDLTAAKVEVLSARWFNPRSGEFRTAGEIRDGDAAQRFIPPVGGDMVLHLKKASKKESRLSPAGPKLKIAAGEDPDIAVGSDGTIHVAYVRDGEIFHRTLEPDGNFGVETKLGPCADPAIALGPAGSPHVGVADSYRGG